MCIDN